MVENGEFTWGNPFWQQPLWRWDAMFAAGVRAHYYASQLVAPSMIAQRRGRGEIMRGRFRTSFTKPVPFTPGQITRVEFPLQDILHTFKKGHRIRVQVPSSWFPLFDRNPQKYVPSIYEAKASDFIKATQRVWVGRDAPSGIEVQLLPAR
jgi:predicted acyl esterase